MPYQLADHTAEGFYATIGQVGYCGREHDVRLKSNSLNSKRASPACGKLFLGDEVDER